MSLTSLDDKPRAFSPSSGIIAIVRAKALGRSVGGVMWLSFSLSLSVCVEANFVPQKNAKWKKVGRSWLCRATAGTLKKMPAF